VATHGATATVVRLCIAMARAPGWSLLRDLAVAAETDRAVVRRALSELGARDWVTTRTRDGSSWYRLGYGCLDAAGRYMAILAAEQKLLQDRLALVRQPIATSGGPGPLLRRVRPALGAVKRPEVSTHKGTADVVDLVDLLLAHQHDASAPELAEALGIHRQTVTLMLEELAYHQWAERCESPTATTYRIGPGLARLGQHVQQPAALIVGAGDLMSRGESP
jgi:DNA-binding IclR family transcriptional regulator